MPILITGNCQRYPLASALQATYSGLQVVTSDLMQAGSKGALPGLAEQIANSQVWITQGSQAETAALLDEIKGPWPRVIRIPAIGFAAFQPDICLVANGTNPASALVAPHFHSTIVAWAYRRGLSMTAAIDLFQGLAFEALGYYDAWEHSVRYLQAAFEASDLADDFEAFFLGIKRHGIFMHTFNHPHAIVMGRLGQLIARRLEGFLPQGFEKASPNAQPEGLVFENVLSKIDWPLYPEIGAYLGIPGGGYRWHFGAQSILGVESFVRYLYEGYQSQGIAPSDLQILNCSLSQLEQLDRALLPSVKMTA
jgi:hypothetical protein